MSSPPSQRATVMVSNATAGFLQRGHPWVRPDRFTRGLDRVAAGQVVDLVDQRGRALASALADPGNEICARVFAQRAGAAFDPVSALRQAHARRAALHADPATDCYRLVHGEADGLPGVRIERYGEVMVVMLLAPCAEPWLDAILESTQQLFPQARLLVRDHQDDLRRRGVADRAHGPWTLDPEAVVIGRELGASYPLRPCSGLATGIYCDQRGTRERLGRAVAGKRVLNLFAYTGAFSIHLLQRGASEAWDVDSSAVALSRGSEAAELNGVATRRRGIRDDCRRMLEACAESFDVIICDPPTAAHGGEGWILRRDYPALLALAVRRLAPRGLLVACVNTLGGKPYPLGEVMAGAAQESGVALAVEAGFELAPDIPQLRGFPEGRPYRLEAVRRQDEAGAA